MLVISLSCYLLSLAFLVILFLSGYFAPVTNHISSDYQRLYLKMFMGMLLLVGIYAIVVTGFVTILSLLVVVFILAWFIPEKKSGTTLISSKAFLIAGATYTVLFLLNLSYQTVFFSTIDVSPYRDINYYADVSNCLNIYGIENNYNYLNIESRYHGTTPYHYFELWITAGLSYVSGIGTNYIFRLCIVPVFQLFLFLFTFSLFRNKNLYTWLAAVLLTYFSGYVPDVLHKISYFQYADLINMYSLSLNYLGVYFLFINAAIICRKNLFLVTSFLLGLSIASFTCFAAITGGLLAYLAIQYLMKKEKRYLYYFFYVLGISVAVLLFYRFTSNKLLNSFDSINRSYFFASDPVGALKNIIGNPITFIVLPLFPFLILAVYNLRKRWSLLLKPISQIFILIILSGFGVYLVLYHMLDSFQLFRNITCIILVMWIIIVAVTSFNKQRRHLITGICIILASGYFLVNYLNRGVFHHETDPQYISAINETTPDALFGIFRKNDPHDEATSIRNMHSHGYLRYGSKHNQNVYLNPLSEMHPDVPKDFQDLVRFSYFINSENDAEYNKQLKKLIEKNNLKYIIMEKGSSLPGIFVGHVTLISIDRFTGNSLYLIKDDQL